MVMCFTLSWWIVWDIMYTSLHLVFLCCHYMGPFYVRIWQILWSFVIFKWQRIIKLLVSLTCSWATKKLWVIQKFIFKPLCQFFCPVSIHRFCFKLVTLCESKWICDVLDISLNLTTKASFVLFGHCTFF